MPSMYVSVTYVYSKQLLNPCMHCPLNYCATALIPLHGTFLTQLHHSNAVAASFSINSLVFRTDCKNVQTLTRLVPCLYSSQNSLQFPREENPSQDKLSV